MKKNAAVSGRGGFGVMQRVAITKVDDKVQVSATNPHYMSNIYRMKNDLSEVASQLISALGGSAKEFDAKYGLTAGNLRKYQYNPVMPFFDDVYKSARFNNQKEAVDTVEKGLAAGIAGVSKVYRLDIPEKEEAVFGVAMTKGCSSDKYIMDRIDGNPKRGTAHLPYEILVSQGEVLSLHPKFRIAQSFPDLNMMEGDYTLF